MAINSTSTPTKSVPKKLTTIDGRYTVGDTRTKPIKDVKMTDNDFDDWQRGFDRIDIAPKDGQLSLGEICDYRNKQVSYAKFSFWTNPKNWFNPENYFDFRSKVREAERETANYMKN